MANDLHQRFRDPTDADAGDLARFLLAAERLPGVRRIRRAMAAALPASMAGRTLLDLGCGAGWETERLATDHPDARVVGVDHNPALIAAARARVPSGRPEWVCADLTAPGFGPGSVDVVRTERVLIYVPDLSATVDVIAALPRPGGRVVAFELDYGGTVLAPGSAAPEVLRRIGAHLEGALPQAWAGRRLPGLLHRREMTVTAEPFGFAVDLVVWQRIVRDTVTAGVADGTLDPAPVEAWLAELDEPGFPGFRAAFTGVLTTAVRTS